MKYSDPTLFSGLQNVPNQFVFAILDITTRNVFNEKDLIVVKYP